MPFLSDALSEGGWCVGMVDYQYQIVSNDPVAELRLAMGNMDGTSYPLDHIWVSHRAYTQSRQYDNIESQKKKKITHYLPIPYWTHNSSQKWLTLNLPLLNEVT